MKRVIAWSLAGALGCALCAGALTVTSVSPDSGSVLGGDAVRVQGSFAVGGANATAVSVVYAGSTMTNYPLLVRWDTRTLVGGGAMRADGADVRVYDADGTTPLGFWFESGLNTTDTLMWVKLPLLTAGTNSIYLGIGTTNTVSASSLTNVLPLLAGGTNVFWLAANRGVSTNASGVMTAWLDQSAAGRVVQQPTANYWPTLRVNALNGLPVARFTSSQKVYTTSAFSNPYTILAVQRQTGGANYRVVNSYGNNWLLGFWQGYKHCMYAEGWVASGTVATDTNWHMHCASGNGSHTAFYANSGVIASNASGVAAPSGLALNGYNGGLSEASDCEVAEVIVFSAYLSAADRQAVHSWLNQKYRLYPETFPVATILRNVSSVRFGGAPASFIELSGGELAATTPEHVPGAVPVEVVSRLGETATLAGAYTYTGISWNDPNWSRQMRLQFTGYTRSETLTNFPALVVLGTHIARFSYGDFLSGTNADLRFFDETGTNELNYEIESWDAAGRSYVWVQVPRLADTNTCVFAKWGRAGMSAPSYTTNAAVWSNGFARVWHLAETSGSLKDSASGVMNGSLFGGATAGVDAVVGRGCKFDGTNGYMQASDAGLPTGALARTMSVWFRKLTPNMGSPGHEIMAYGPNSGGNRFALWQGGSTATLGAENCGVGRLFNWTYDGGWHQLVAMVPDGATVFDQVQIYYDGQPQNVSGSGTLNTMLFAFRLAAIPGFDGSGYYFDAVMDEARVSSVARSTNWVWAEYMTVGQNAALTTYSPVAGALPSVANAAPTGITALSASLNGFLNGVGSTSLTSVAVYWGENDGQGVATNWAHAVPISPMPEYPQAISVGVTGLTESTTYYYRFYASNVHGESWASTSRSFITLPDYGTWNNRLAIRFPGYTKAEPLTNFPVLVVLGPHIPGFRYSDFQSALNDDLRFLDSTESVELNYEIEKWDPNGSSHVWVQLPRLEGTNTIIYALWGHGGLSAPACRTNGATWSEGFLGVWHLASTGAVSALDSGPQRYNGTLTGGVAVCTGRVDGAAAFDGSSGSIYRSGGAFDRANGQPLTVSAWINPGRYNNYQDLVGSRSEYLNWLLYQHATDGSLQLHGNNQYKSAYLPPTNAWTHVAATVSASSNSLLYANGSVVQTTAGFQYGSAANRLTIGSYVNYGTPYEHWLGRMDELRISAVARSTNWVWAEYMSMASNETFAVPGGGWARAPIVENLAAADVTMASAALNGGLIATGASAVTEVRVYWGANDGQNAAGNWAHTNTLAAPAGAPAALSVTITGLAVNTLYYYRFYAANSSGTNWAASSRSFITLPGAYALGGLITTNNEYRIHTFTNIGEAVLNMVNGGAVEFFIWGAGGAGGYAGTGVGGGGGFSSGMLMAEPGTNYVVMVGQGGAALGPNAGPGTRPAGGGGLVGTLGYGGQGGGLSGLFRGAYSFNETVAVAGGGGGASYENMSGGAGGGAAGVDGLLGSHPGGQGGTQTAGGTGVVGTVSGSMLQGGDSAASGDGGGGGGGGSGYWGGGAGSGYGTGSAGGGGSGYVGGPGAVDGATVVGDGQIPARTNHSFYLAGRGWGGAAGTNAGGAGLVVLRYPMGEQPRLAGRITNALTGAGVAGVKLLTEDGAEAAVSDASGYFNLAVTNGWSGRLLPVSGSFMFTPPARGYTNTIRSLGLQNFSARDLSAPVSQGCLGGDVAQALDDCSLVISNGGNLAWSAQTAVSKDGVSSARSGGIGHSQETWMQTTVTGPGALSFWWKVSSESCCDPLNFYIDGVSQADIRGEIHWQQKAYSITSGTHTLKWRYAKDGSVTNGTDAAWVDQVQWTPAERVFLSDLVQVYNGQPRPVTVTTSPTGLTVVVTYNGGAGAPVETGEYAVVASVGGVARAMATMSIIPGVTISGAVRNQLTGETVEGATVRFSDGTSVVTAEDGTYTRVVFGQWNGMAWPEYSGASGFVPAQRLYEAVSASMTNEDYAMTPPMGVVGATPTGLVNQAVAQLDIRFLRNVHGPSFSLADVALTGPGGVVTPTSFQQISGTRIRIYLPAQTADGLYSCTVGPAIQAVDGSWMDQDRDGTGGEPEDIFEFTFTIDRTPPAAPTVSGFDLAPATNVIPQPPISLTGGREAGTDVFIDGVRRAERGSGSWAYDVTNAQRGTRAVTLYSTDLAANTSAVAQLNFLIQWDKMFTASATVDVNNLLYENKDVLLNGATVTVNGAHTFGTLALTNGGKIVTGPAPMGSTNRLSISATRILIYSNSAIDVTGAGWTGTNTVSGAGGSHGGMGGYYVYSGAQPADVYGDYQAPVWPGLGGSPADPTVRGGGALYVQANELVLDGAIRADGAGKSNGGRYGGGAGGSIWLSVGILRGAGSLSARGGTIAYPSEGAGGGGGRVAVCYADGSGFNWSNLWAQGGTGANGNGPSGAGTIYIKDANQPAGLVKVDNTAGHGTNGLTVFPAALMDPLVAVSSAVRLAASGVLSSVTGSNSVFYQMAGMTGSTIRLVGGSWSQGGALALQNLEATGGLWTATGPLSVSGNFSLKGATLTACDLLDLPFGGRLLVDGWTLCRASTQQWSDITLTNGAVLTQPITPQGQTNGMSLVAATIRISTNSAIDLTGTGWTGTNSAGYPGGSHGGMGGYSVYYGGVLPPDTYGDYRLPITPGLGASPSNTLARGGGALRLEVADLIVDGAIRADGARGGAGGSIWLSAGTLRGAGTLSARGGSMGGATGGGGGGGRVAVYYNSATGFNLANVRVEGGWGYNGDTPSGAGTMYFKDESQPVGLVRIDNSDSYGSNGVTVLQGELSDPVVAVSGTIRWPAGADLASVIGTNCLFQQTGAMTVSSLRLVGGSWSQGAALSVQNLQASNVTWTVNGRLTVSDGFNFKDGTLTQYDWMDLPFGGALCVDGWTLNLVYTQQWTDITLTNGAKITHPATGYLQTNRVFLEARSIHIAPGSSIDVSGAGWTGTNAINGAGGSHGGLGATVGTSYPPPTYDDYLAPVLPGYGGAVSNSSYRGGGVIRLKAEDLLLDGLLKADGAQGYGTGAGAGGSIWVETDVLRGVGSLSVNGGINTWGYGCGGGGRIAIYYGDASEFVLSRATATGGQVGNSYGGSNGTVYTENRVAPLTVQNMTPSGPVNATVSNLVIRFKAQVDTNTFALNDLSLAGPSGAIGLTNLAAVDALVFAVTLVTPAAQDGTYTLTVGPGIAHVGGVYMTNAWSGEFILDRAPPEAPAVTNWAMAPAVSNLRTNSALLQGTREAYTSVRINGAEAVPFAFSPSWSNRVALAEGSNDLAIVSRDAAGNDSAESHVLFFVDTIAPQVSGVSPPNDGHTNAGGGSILVAINETGSGVDLDRSVHVLKRGANVIAGAWSLNGATLQFTPQGELTDGVYTNQVRPMDVMGNTGAFFISKFTIDRVAPSAPGVDPVSTPTVIAHQQITGLKEPYAGVWLNGTTQLVANTSSESWSCDVPLALGANVLSFAQRDRAGNTSAATTVTITYDNQAPGPVTVLADGEREGTTVQLSWSAYNEVANGDDIANYRVYRSAASFDNILLASQVGTTTSGVKSFLATGLTRGAAYWFAVVAVDRTGQYQPEVTATAVTAADVTPPGNPGNLTFESFRSNVVAHWSAPADADLAGFRLFFNQTTSAVELASSTTSWDAGGDLPPATGFTVRIRSFDTTGNESLGTVGPAATWLRNPAHVWAAPRYGAVDLSWSASTPTQYVRQYWVYMATNLFTNVAGMSPRAVTPELSRSLAGLTVGETYYFGVVVENINGGMNPNVVQHESENIYSNEVVNGVTNVVLVGVSNTVINSTASTAPIADTNAPTVHFVTFNGVIMDAETLVRYPGSFGARVSDNSGLSRLEYWLDGALQYTDTSGQTNSSWSWNGVKAAGDGAHSLVLAAFDSFGNSRRTTNAFQVALGPPLAAATISYPQNNAVFLNQSRVTVQGSADAYAEQVAIYLNSVQTGLVAVAGGGGFSFALDLKEGTNRLTAVAQNRGGVGPMSGVIKVLATNVPPDQPLPPEVELPPNAPTVVSAAAQPSGAVNVVWGPPWPLVSPHLVGQNVMGYYVYRATNSFSATNAAARLNTVPLVTGSYRDQTPADRTYYYRVAAVNSKGEFGPLSAEASALSDRVPPRVTNITYRSAEIVSYYQVEDPVSHLHWWRPYTNSPALFTNGYFREYGGIKVDLEATEPLIGGVDSWSRGPTPAQQIQNIGDVRGPSRGAGGWGLGIDLTPWRTYVYGHFIPVLKATDAAGNLAVLDMDPVPTLNASMSIGPVITNVIWDPPPPILNDPSHPVTVRATVFFEDANPPMVQYSEAQQKWVSYMSKPFVIKHRLADRHYNEVYTNYAWIDVSEMRIATTNGAYPGLPSSSVWQVTFTLQKDAGKVWGEHDRYDPYKYHYRYIYNEQCTLGHDGATDEYLLDPYADDQLHSLDSWSYPVERRSIKLPNIEVYQLPPLDVYKLESGFLSYSGGVVNIRWVPSYQHPSLPPTVRTPRPGESYSYQLYRVQVSGGVTSYTWLASTTDTNFTETLPSDGVYGYGVVTVMTSSNGVSTSDISRVFTVLDRTPPQPPTDVRVYLYSTGLKLSWTPPAGESNLSWKIFYDTEPFATTNGRTPIASGRYCFQSNFNASLGPNYFGVTAVDAYTNESALSALTFTNILSVPVSGLALDYFRGGNPVFGWTHTNRASLVGFNVYVNSGGTTSKVTEGYLSPWTPSYADPQHDGSNRAYGVSATVLNGPYYVDSLVRWIDLPLLSASLDTNSMLKRGIFNRLTYAVTNRSAYEISNIIFSAFVQGSAYSSQTFAVSADGGTNITLVVAGYTNLDNRVTISNRLAFSPAPGEQVRIMDTNGMTVGNDRFVATIQPELFYRGGIGRARFTLQNTSQDDIEIVMAEKNGTEKSSEVRLKLLDSSGTLFWVGDVMQAVGPDLVTLSGGTTVVRIAAGRTFTSTSIEMQVSSFLGTGAVVRLEIDRIHYRLGYDEHVAVAGPIVTRRVGFDDTPYFVVVTNVTPAWSIAPMDFGLSGLAYMRDGVTMAARRPVRVVIGLRGFERVYDLNTDANGRWAMTFRPLNTEGGVYDVSAMHPDLVERTVQKQFEIRRVMVTPAAMHLTIPRNYTHDVNVAVTPNLDLSLAGAYLAYIEEDQTNGVFAPGVTVTPSAPISIRNGRTGWLSFTIRGDDTAPDTGTLYLRLVTTGNEDTPWNTVRVRYTFAGQAAPNLAWSPSYVDVGVLRSNSVTERVELRNVGFLEMENVSLSLVTTNGEPAPDWIMLNGPSAVGNLATGATRIVHVTFSPTNGVPLTPTTPYRFNLRVAADNHDTRDVALYVTVDESGRGGVAFHVADIYTGTLDAQSQTIRGLAGARIRLTKESGVEVETNLVSDAWGEAEAHSLPSGRYTARISAPEHKSATARVWIREGTVAAEEVFLENTLVTVEWSVTPTVIQDHYEVVLTTTFKTEVPAAVIVCEPTSITLPAMEPGDVFNGEFTVKNYGLIQAEDAVLKVPGVTDDLKIEVMAELPSVIPAQGIVRMPYRVVRLASRTDEGAGGGGCPTACMSVNARYKCPSNYKVDCGAPMCITLPCVMSGEGDMNPVKPAEEEEVEGSTSGSVGGGGSGPIEKPEQTSLTTPAAEEECKGSKSGEEKNPDCGGGDGQEPVGSWVDLVAGKFNDSIDDLVVPVIGPDLAVTRTFTGNKWKWNFLTSTMEYSRVFSDGITIQRTDIDQHMTSVDPLDGTMWVWTETQLGLYWRAGEWHCFSYKLGSDCWPLEGGAGTVEMEVYSNALRYTISGEETWVYDECAVSNFHMATLLRRESWSRLVKRVSPLGTELSYAYDNRGRTEGVYDHFGHRVLWMNYDEAGNLASVSDAATGGRTVQYQYDAAARLTNVIGVLGVGHAYAYENGKLVYERTPGGREIHITHSGTNMSSLVTRTEDQLGWKQFNYAAVAKTSVEGAFGAKVMAGILDSRNILREIWFGTVGLSSAAVRFIEKINGQEVYRKPAEPSGPVGPGVLRDKPKTVTDNKNGRVTVWFEDGTSVSTQCARVGSPERGWNPVEFWDEAGRRTTFTYDQKGRLTSVKQLADSSEARETITTYDQHNEVESIELKGAGETPSAVTRFTYNEKGLTTSVTQPEGGVTQYGFDENGSLTTVITPRNFTWQPVQDARGRLVSLTDPLDQVTSNAYDAADNLVWMRELDGRVWTFGYDVRGRLLVSSNSYGEVWRRTYEGDVLTRLDAPGRGMIYEYDSLGRLARVADDAGNGESWQRDALGRITNRTSAYGETTSIAYESDTRTNVAWMRIGGVEVTNTYDPRGRIVYSATAWGTNRVEQRFGFDVLGHCTSAYETGLGEITYSRNGYGYPTQIVNEAGHVVRRRHDLRNRLVSRTDANGNETRYGYDREGRLVSTIYADGATISNVYDAAGNVQRVTDAMGNYAESVHDGLDRLVQRTLYRAGGQAQKTVTYTYHPSGPLASYGDGTTSGSFSFDRATRTETRTFQYPTFEKSLVYTYDPLGRKTSCRGLDGQTNSYSYDSLGRLQSIAVPGEGLITFSEYQGLNAGRMAFPGGVVQSVYYDEIGNVASSVVRDAAGDVILAVSCEWDSLQRMVRRTVNGEVETYTYDRFGQLTSAGPYQWYAYDPLGNLTNGVLDQGGVTWQYDNRNRLLGGSGLACAYDANGSLTSRTVQGTTVFYRYHAEGNLAELLNTQGVTIASYDYNPWGKRLRKNVGGTNTYYFYSQEGLAAELSANGAVLRTYGYAPDGVWNHMPLYTRIGSNTYYYLNDPAGMPRRLINGSGQVVWSAEYEPFGAAHVDTNSAVVNNLRGSSQYYDQESGLHYNLLRYYDPRLARYISADPLGELADLNTYRFVGNSPITGVDPLGLMLFAFDGTSQNMHRGDVDNVTRMYDAYMGDKHYYDGLGSGVPTYPDDPMAQKVGAAIYNGGDFFFGALFGAGGDAKMERAYRDLQNSYFKSKDKNIDIIGFSRGAALARAFANMINERGLVDPCTGERVFPQIRFLGLYDTVGSFGTAPFSHYAHEWGKNLALAPNVKKASHALARHEHRVLFPLTRLKADPRVTEKTFDGYHGDIGGCADYEDRQLEAGYNPLLWMMEQGIETGAPFRMNQLPPEIHRIEGAGVVIHDSSYTPMPYNRSIYER